MDLLKRVWRKAKFEASYTSDVLSKHEPPAKDHDANVVCSDLRGQEQPCRCPLCGTASTVPASDRKHLPVIDLDVPVTLVPSSTPGHSHLFIDKEVSWDKFCKLLDALEDAGLVEYGYVARSKARGYTAVRLPWVKKGDRGI